MFNKMCFLIQFLLSEKQKEPFSFSIIYINNNNIYLEMSSTTNQMRKATTNFATHTDIASKRKNEKPNHNISAQMDRSIIQYRKKIENPNASISRKTEREDTPEKEKNQLGARKGFKSSLPTKQQQEKIERQDKESHHILNRYRSNVWRSPHPEGTTAVNQSQEGFGNNHEKKPSSKIFSQSDTFEDNFLRHVEKPGRYGSSKRLVNKNQYENKRELRNSSVNEKIIESEQSVFSQTSPINKLILSPSEKQISEEGQKLSESKIEGIHISKTFPVRRNSTKQIKKSDEIKETKKANNNSKKFISKLFLHQLERVFHQMKTATWHIWMEKDRFFRDKIQKIAKLLIYSIINVWKSNESRQKKIIFTQFRNILYRQNKKMLKIQQKMRIGTQSQKNTFLSILFRIQCQKLGEYFGRIKEKAQKKKFINIVIQLLWSYSEKEKKKKLKELVQKIIKLKTKQYFTFQQLHNIRHTFLRFVKSEYLNRLYFVCRSFESKYSSEQKTQTPTKLTKHKVIPIEKKLSEEQNRHKHELEVLRIRLEQVKEEKREEIFQLQFKNKTNQELKYLLQTLPERDQENINMELQEREETRFPFLSDIYIQALKNPLASFQLSSIVQDIETFEGTSNTQQWKELLRSLELKGIAQIYQGRTQREHRAIQSLSIEYKVLEQIVREYVRQRYLWEWVRNCVANQ